MAHFQALHVPYSLLHSATLTCLQPAPQVGALQWPLSGTFNIASSFSSFDTTWVHAAGLIV
jgi:hypothetical protein